MPNNKITISFTRNQLRLLLAVLIFAGLPAGFFFARAAFIEPTAGPAASSQDFAQNILGANNADNAFDSSLVASNTDGSIIERLEYMAGTYLEPRIVLEPSTSIDYSIFKNLIWDDWKGSAVSTSSDLASAYAGAVDQNKEEGEWTAYTDSSLGTETIASGAVYRDERTELYWSDCYSAAQDGTCDTRTNSFTLDGVIADTDDGLDAEGGQAVDFCESLSLDADGDGIDETDWYLPSQKELLLAYINGAANNIPSPALGFWSSTEYYFNSSSAWYVYLAYGGTYASGRTNSLYARCVRR